MTRQFTVVATTAGKATANASVSANGSADPVKGNNSTSQTTEVVAAMGPPVEPLRLRLDPLAR